MITSHVCMDMDMHIKPLAYLEDVLSVTLKKANSKTIKIYVDILLNRPAARRKNIQFHLIG